MGTKRNPGRYDCHDAALPDEERFTLLARDPLAGFLVSIWSSLRYGDAEAAQAKCKRMIEVGMATYWPDVDPEPASEALDCAMRMFAWREANLGRWRDGAAEAPARSYSADAELAGESVRVRLYASDDPGPLKEFRPYADIALDEPHALELFGMLSSALYALTPEGRR